MRLRAAANRQRVAAAFTTAFLGIGALAFAQEMRYEGDIVALDGKANTFTVKGTTPGAVMEMAFHAAPTTEMMIDGERVMFGELVKGDHVVVAYESTGNTHTVHRADRKGSGPREMTFAGDIVGVDVKAQTFTVKNTTDGKVAEMRFHVNPTSRLYFGGEENVLLAQLRAGDFVNVTYESTDATTHNAKHVKRMKTTS